MLSVNTSETLQAQIKDAITIIENVKYAINTAIIEYEADDNVEIVSFLNSLLVLLG